MKKNCVDVYCFRSVDDSSVVVVALLLLCGPSCADPQGNMMKSRSKDTSPRLRLNSVGESNMSNFPENPKNPKAKPKNPQKNGREKKRVEVVATAYRELRSALGADEESRRRTTKVETLQVSVRYIHDLTKELAGLQLPSSDRMYPATEPSSHTVQANLVRICACFCILPGLLF